MATEPIYKLFLLKRLTERWLRLSQAEQTELTAQLNKGLAAAGGQQVITCASSWSNEAYLGWGVEEYPNFERLREYDALCMKLEWYSYVDSWSILGTQHAMINPADLVPPEPGKLYVLFMVQGAGFTEAHEQLSQPDKDALWVREGQERQDAKWVVVANSYWSNEDCAVFGVNMFPDYEAVRRHYAHLEKINWPRYMRARSLLGTIWQGQM